MSSEQTSEYQKNSYKSIRSAINRHLQDLGRDIDIVRGKEFRSSNSILDGKLKKNLQEGLARPTKHKEIINTADLEKISTYLYENFTPVALRFRIWFLLSIQFVSRGLEFHEQLKPNSFVFKTDENGHEYATLSHSTKQKNWQGGIDTADGPKEKRMYAIPDLGQKCPVNSLKLFLAKTDPNATSLFNHCVKKALSSPEEEDVWFSNVPVKQYQFSRFMSDISKNAKCSTSYTAHCLRATAIQGMNDAGFEIRHIMHMSGHKNESSVRSYNRDCSTAQKKQMSDILNGLTLKPQTTNCSVIPHTAPNPESMSVDEFASSAAFTVPRALSMQSSHFLSSGFMSNSTFNNCTFKFEK